MCGLTKTLNQSEISLHPSEFTFAIEDTPADSVKDTIVKLVVEFNNAQVGPGNGRPLFVVIRDRASNVIGGMSGSTSRGWLFIDHLIVPQSARGSGIGREVMLIAEAEAITRGCRHAWLNTYEFQARGFYEKLGYTCFGQLQDFPPGYARFFMSKRLEGAPRDTD
jgi:GNAT superfamily N-acetyltransferase